MYHSKSPIFNNPKHPYDDFCRTVVFPVYLQYAVDNKEIDISAAEKFDRFTPELQDELFHEARVRCFLREEENNPPIFKFIPFCYGRYAIEALNEGLITLKEAAVMNLEFKRLFDSNNAISVYCNYHQCLAQTLESCPQFKIFFSGNFFWENGTPPLLIAIQNGNIEIVNALIQAGADCNKANIHGETPLYIASQNGYSEIVNALVQAGADCNKANINGETPLYIAAQNGYNEIVTLLIEAGAKLTESEILQIKTQTMRLF